jgi:hypothetical protein
MCPLLFVISDGKQGSQLCCRVNGPCSSICCHHQLRDCLFDDLDNPEVECSFISINTVNDMCCNECNDEVHEFSLYKVDNSFPAFRWANDSWDICVCRCQCHAHCSACCSCVFTGVIQKGLGAQTLGLLDKMALLSKKMDLFL